MPACTCSRWSYCKQTRLTKAYPHLIHFLPGDHEKAPGRSARDRATLKAGVMADGGLCQTWELMEKPSCLPECARLSGQETTAMRALFLRPESQDNEWWPPWIQRVFDSHWYTNSCLLKSLSLTPTRTRLSTLRKKEYRGGAGEWKMRVGNKRRYRQWMEGSSDLKSIAWVGPEWCFPFQNPRRGPMWGLSE